ncbi:NAC domain-containing protein 72-like isoform X2 [Tasmannia lanceolata]|uniref:NAC domain-containing protein 72-like isoform X2 n=1 Tax=Tasmannia lanceolata TaxID=3420 RepID=UPI004063C8ED
MARGSLPPGFRFHPTDEELVRYYLKRKVMGKSLCFEAITELDLYKFAPWDLPEKSCWQSKDLEWYFVSPRDRKYANGPRTNRATDIGYWKTTGKDRSICHNSRTVGMKKTLVFHLGRAPRGTRTDWVMHEYRLEDLELVDAGISQDAYVLCKIFQKSGPGPKNGEQHGAPFKEEEWEDDMGDDSLIPFPLVGPRSPSLPPVDDQNIIMTKSTFETGEGSGSLLGSCTLQSGSSGGGEEHPSLPECDDVGKLLLDILCNEDGASYSQGNGVHENQEPVAPNINLKDAVASDSDDIFNDLEDITIQEMLSGINNDSYIELKDLGYPREANDDGYGFSDNLFSSFDNLQSVVTTDPEIDVSRRNPMWEFQVGMHSSATPFVQAADVENTHILQPLGEDPAANTGSATSGLW